jgi:hypothetical protein
MKKQIFLSIVAVLPLLAQVPPAGNSFQQAGWLTMPNSLSPLDGQSGPVIGKPVSASEVRRTEQTLSDGSHVNNSETEHFYRDAMGRMRTETSSGAVIFDPVAGFTYDLTTGRKTFTKSRNKQNAVTTIAAAAHRSSTSSQSVESKQSTDKGNFTEDLAPQFLHGVYAKGSRITVIIPAGTFGNDRDLKVVNERWFSDDLKLLLRSSNSDPRFGVTTYELTDISQAPPDPALFQVPTDYTEGH